MILMFTDLLFTGRLFTDLLFTNEQAGVDHSLNPAPESDRRQHTCSLNDSTLAINSPES